MRRYGFLPKTRSQWQDLAVAIIFAILCVGLQVLGLLEGSTARGTFCVAIWGYVTVVGFTIGLLAMVKSEIVAEYETLPAVFENAYWTFSDSRHAEHKPFGGPTIQYTRGCSASRKKPKRDVACRNSNHCTCLRTVHLLRCALSEFACVTMVGSYGFLRHHLAWGLLSSHRLP